MFAFGSATQTVRIFPVTLVSAFPRLGANRFAKECLAVLATEDDGFNVFGRT